MKIIVLVLCILLVTGCNEKETLAEGQITGEQAQVYVEEGNTKLVDVRTDVEFDEGHIDGAISIPMGTPKVMIERMLKDKEERIIVYCRSGNRSHTFVNELKEMGYTNVYDLGAMDNWNS